MEDLIKESESGFRAQVDNYDSIFWTKNGNEEDNDCLSEEAILDWHTKQMEKAYNKGREETLKDILEYVQFDIDFGAKNQQVVATTAQARILALLKY